MKASIWSFEFGQGGDMGRAICLLTVLLFCATYPQTALGGKYAIKVLEPPDDALYLTHTESETWGVALDVKEDRGLRTFIENAYDKCKKRKAAHCSLVSRLVRIEFVEGSNGNSISFTADWDSGYCGATGLCSIWVYDRKKKTVTFLDGHGVKVANGKLMWKSKDGPNYTWKPVVP